MECLFCLKCFLLVSIFINLTKAFVFQCPSSNQWMIRAKSHCVITDGYICLFDENTDTFREFCRNETYFDPAGHKLIFAGNLDRKKCESTRYQPFTFSTNGMSSCIFEKTHCSEEGQINFDIGSPHSDRICRCDYSRGYDFNTKPKHGCHCFPSMEDCSCYQKPCQSGFILSPDYQCVNLSNWNSQVICELIVTESLGSTKTTIVDTDAVDSQTEPVWNLKFILKMLTVSTISVGVLMVIMAIFCFPKLESFTNAKKSIVKENVELRSLLSGTIIPRNIMNLQKDLKEQWKEQFGNFILTKASVDIMKAILKEQCVIITGPFGCGKSCTAFNVAMEIEKQNDTDVMIITDPNDLFKYASENKSQIFFIDDVFGKYFVSNYNTAWWYRQGQFIANLLRKNNNLKLLMTSRLNIYLSVNIKQLNITVSSTNLFSKEFALTLDERKMIGKRYLGDKIDYLGEEVNMSYSFFPALCSNFCHHKEENIIEYFTNPVEYIMNEMENIRKSPDFSYLALVLLIICDNNVNKDILDNDNHRHDRMLRFASKEIGYGKKPPKSLLRSRLISLKDSFVLETESAFRCLHTNYFNILAFSIGPMIINSLLLYGTTSFINERMHLETLLGHFPKLSIPIPMALQVIYFERMMLDLKSGLFDTFKCYQHALPVFRKSFIAYLETNLKKSDLEKIEGATTILHVVSTEGYEDYTDLFLRLNKELINKQDNLGRTALHKACIEGHINVAELLLNNKARIAMIDNDTNTALDLACANGLYDTVSFLLSRRAPIKQKRKDFQTALHVASNNNYLKIAELLLKNNAKVNEKDYHGHTPLHLACRKGNIDIVDLLISYNAQVNMLDNKKRTALYFAAENKYINIIQALLKSEANPDLPFKGEHIPLHCACKHGYLEVVEMLIKHKDIVDIDAPDIHGRVPLYYACEKGHVGIAELLLFHNANVNKIDHLQNTPIFIACKNNFINVVKLLVGHGADVNSNNIAKLTPLHIAGMNNYKDIVSILVEHGALIKDLDKNSQTPSELARQQSYQLVAAELLERGTLMHEPSNTGQIALHIASEIGDAELV